MIFTKRNENRACPPPPGPDIRLIAPFLFKLTVSSLAATACKNFLDQILQVLQKRALRLIYFAETNRDHAMPFFVPQPLNIFILKNLDSMSNEMLSSVLGSKFGTRYLK